jgi:hypothetical protein
MIIEDLMIHGSLPRSSPVRQKPRSRSVGAVRRIQERSGPQPLPAHQACGEWDEGIRYYKEHQLRRAEAGETDRPTRRRLFRIEDDTPIVPRAVAELVCEETSLWLREPFPRGWTAELAEWSDVIYQHNARFRQRLRRPGDAGRECLISYMRHWLVGLLASRRPDLRERLPDSYAVGRDLPPPDAIRPPRL